ncbi:MAG: YjbQ family protein [Candidatus Scalindua sp.]|jgi:secondary thiamine-phosphate synthase enzyme|nr:YjbQ family protein [Candidatus Scalindua sp.]MBT5306665.1 YjbQ family protein [Candidatus Scalindua sp.]MBT6048790.1 YjbQ family protein [Candidatus Scalindua sp.]MBT6230620.1 YjbQ family protein [Candidatus Scalindua sp.]MBT6561673.1 YjbQ family protein [Candidatus Scalindua sp.]
MIKQFSIKTSRRNEFIDITSQIQEIVGEVSEGVVTVFVPHTTTGITINENADPDVPRDILKKLESLIPQSDNYSHMEGNSDAHIKASLFGSSVSVIVKDGRLLLGTWQSIFFCEFDGPRTRMFYAQV